MPGLQQFVAFAETAKQGGFAAAARQLGTAPSTISKSVQRLEDSLGVKLFHRTTRQVTLTPDGQRMYQRCQRVLAELEDLRADASGARETLSGTLRIDLPVFYGKRFVMPLLADLRRRHPELKMDISLTDLQVDLVRSGIDLAVRIGPLRDSSLVAQRVDRQALVLCGSPAYLAEHGTPHSMADLQRHALIVFRLPNTGRDRSWQLREQGRAVDYVPHPHVRVGETEGLVEAVKLGMGLCQVPDMLVQDEIASGALQEVLPTMRPPAMPIHIVYPSGRLLPARVRVTIDALQSLKHRLPG